jgi:hypothetical protein
VRDQRHIFRWPRELISTWHTTRVLQTGKNAQALQFSIANKNKFLYSLLTLIFKVSVISHANSSTRYLRGAYYGIECMPGWSSIPTAVDVKLIQMCNVDAILICFSLPLGELQHFLVTQKFYYSESSYEFYSLACSVLSVSIKYVFQR